MDSHYLSGRSPTGTKRDATEQRWPDEALLSLAGGPPSIPPPSGLRTGAAKRVTDLMSALVNHAGCSPKPAPHTAEPAGTYWAAVTDTSSMRT